jgi:hypothetical protein
MESAIKQQTDYIWQDREIRFDCKPQLLQCRRGEEIIGKFKTLPQSTVASQEAHAISIVFLFQIQSTVLKTPKEIMASVGPS